MYLIKDLLLLCSTDNGARYANDVRMAIVRRVNLLQQAHGLDRFIPKAHLVLNLATMLERHGQLVSCFVRERRHKELKRFANELDNFQAGAEKHITREMILCHIEDMINMDVINEVLIEGKPATADVLAHVRATLGVGGARPMQVSGQAYFRPNRAAHTGDVVVVAEPESIAEVAYHVACDNYLLTRVLFYEEVMPENCFRVRRDRVGFIRTRDIKATCVFNEKDGVCRVAPQMFEAD